MEVFRFPLRTITYHCRNITSLNADVGLRFLSAENTVKLSKSEFYLAHPQRGFQVSRHVYITLRKVHVFQSLRAGEGHLSPWPRYDNWACWRPRCLHCGACLLIKSLPKRDKWVKWRDARSTASALRRLRGQSHEIPALVPLVWSGINNISHFGLPTLSCKVSSLVIDKNCFALHPAELRIDFRQFSAICFYFTLEKESRIEWGCAI